MRKLMLALALLIPQGAVADEIIKHQTAEVCVTPTLATAGTYAAGGVIGDEMTFSGLVRKYAKGATVTGVTITSEADAAGNNAFDQTLHIFHTTVAGTTTDNSAFDPTDADLLAKACRVVITAADDCDSFADNGQCYKAASCPVEAQSEGSDLFAVLESEGTPTLADGDISVCITVSQD